MKERKKERGMKNRGKKGMKEKSSWERIKRRKKEKFAIQTAVVSSKSGPRQGGPRKQASK